VANSIQEIDQQISKIFDKYKPYVVSLSEPYRHDYTLEGTELNEPAGGLTAALDPIFQKYGGKWIATTTGDADSEFVDDKGSEMVPPENPSYELRRINLSHSMVQNFYYGFNHETFWPLLHTVFHRPDFKQEYWDSYRRANSLYADVIMEELGEERPFLWFQDFQLALAPRKVREKIDKRDVPMVHFWHVPWPPPEVFHRCPWSNRILDGLLANDLIGFHTKNHVSNFLKTVDSLEDTQVSTSQMEVQYKGNKTSVVHSPISVDFKEIDSLARSKEVEKKMEDLKSFHYLEDNAVGLGIDRLDYSKGIPERLKAIDQMLSNFPRYKESFVFVQAGAPILSRVADYRNLTHKVDSMVDEINQKHEKNSWRPIWFLKEKVDLPSLRALQRIADIYVVTSLHDGMNLVAKENVAADVDCDGNLLLSEFTGAAEELEEATLVNPYDTEGLSNAIRRGLDVSKEERKEKMQKMRERVRENDIYSWLSEFLKKAIESTSL
jgi:trehalose-6-phosphate synthase